jgi:hypothetical protein
MTGISLVTQKSPVTIIRRYILGFTDGVICRPQINASSYTIEGRLFLPSVALTANKFWQTRWWFDRSGNHRIPIIDTNPSSFSVWHSAYESSVEIPFYFWLCSLNIAFEDTRSMGMAFSALEKHWLVVWHCLFLFGTLLALAAIYHIRRTVTNNDGTVLWLIWCRTTKYCIPYQTLYYPTNGHNVKTWSY